MVVACLAGCITREPRSEAWRKAEESITRERWSYTNGMAWPAVDGVIETVLIHGMCVSARNSEGQITIKAGAGYERSYTWNGATRSVNLWPRKSRWYGSRGIYFPGPGQHWKSNGGITRGVLNEGVLWFKTKNDALAWIRQNQSAKYCVYSADGLMVNWQKVPARKQLNVDVWQIMVAGEKPTSLEGSENDRIAVTMDSITRKRSSME